MEKTKNIPKIRYKGYKDEWEKKELGAIAEINMGQSPNGNSYSLRPIKNGYILIQGNADLKNRQVTPRVWTSEITKMAEANDIIMSVRAPAGIVGKTKYKAVIGRGVAAIKGNEFLYQLLIKMEKTYWQSISTGSTFESIDKKTISNAMITYPSSEEQKQIGSLFKNLDEKLEIEREKHEKLVNFKKAMLENAFPKEGEKRPKIRFGGYNDDWEETQLNDIGKKYTSLTGKTKEDFGHGEGKYITFTNILANPVALLEGVEKIEIDKSQNEVKEGDLFFNISSETYEEVGMSSIWIHNKENYYLNSFCMGFRPTIELDSYFITYLLRSSAVRKQIMKLAQGISRINISQTKMLDIFISIPSIKEQKLIGSFFKNLDEKIQVSEEKISKIENFKKAMMDAMFV